MCADILNQIYKGICCIVNSGLNSRCFAMHLHVVINLQSISAGRHISMYIFQLDCGQKD